jgi:hypothetical protein
VGNLAGEVGKEFALELILGFEENGSQFAEPERRILVVEIIETLERIVGL